MKKTRSLLFALLSSFCVVPIAAVVEEAVASDHRPVVVHLFIETKEGEQ